MRLDSKRNKSLLRHSKMQKREDAALADEEETVDVDKPLTVVQEEDDHRKLYIILEKA